MKEYAPRKSRLPALENAVRENQSPDKVPNSVYNDIFASKKHPTSEMLGHRQDLAPSMEAKMSRAFGMDLKGIHFYRSNAMNGGMQGLASGNRIILSGDVNLNTMEGQAVLGHELSHIHAQSMGIGMGHTGLYENAALEHQADTEGMLAAHGQSIFGESSSMSEAPGLTGFGSLTSLGPGMGASAGAPMQANKRKKKQQAEALKYKAQMNSEIARLKHLEARGRESGANPMSKYWYKPEDPTKSAPKFYDPSGPAPLSETLEEHRQAADKNGDNYTLTLFNNLLKKYKRPDDEHLGTTEKEFDHLWWTKHCNVVNTQSHKGRKHNAGMEKAAASDRKGISAMRKFQLAKKHSIRSKPTKVADYEKAGGKALMPIKEEDEEQL